MLGCWMELVRIAGEIESPTIKTKIVARIQSDHTHTLHGSSNSAFLKSGLIMKSELCACRPKLKDLGLQISNA